jgi:hypothetical protein
MVSRLRDPSSGHFLAIDECHEGRVLRNLDRDDQKPVTSADMVRFATEFGMTPSSRARVSGAGVPNSDPADGYF